MYWDIFKIGSEWFGGFWGGRKIGVEGGVGGDGEGEGGNGMGEKEVGDDGKG